MNRKDECVTCIYWDFEADEFGSLLNSLVELEKTKVESDDFGKRECKRFPPPSHDQSRPEMRFDDWCGEHSFCMERLLNVRMSFAADILEFLVEKKKADLA